MFRDSSDEPSRPNKDVDVKNCTTKYDSCKEMEVPDNEPQCFMKRPLQGIGLVQYLLGDWVLIPILDIGKANGLERATSAFLMAKYASFSCLCCILIGCEHRRDYC